MDFNNVHITYQATFQVILKIRNGNFGAIRIRSATFGLKNTTFEKIELNENARQKLFLACEFQTMNGQIENILFKKNDNYWSMEMKKFILNLINLQRLSKNYGSNTDENKAFVTLEKSIDGNCHNVYTVSPPHNEGRFHVEKEVDFGACEASVVPLQQFLNVSSAQLLNHCLNRDSKYTYHLKGNPMSYGGRSFSGY